MVDIKTAFYTAVEDNDDTVAVANWAADIGPAENVYYMADFNEIEAGRAPWEIARATCCGKFCAAWEYYALSSIGHYISFRHAGDALEWANTMDAIEDEPAAFFDEFPQYLDEFGAYFARKNKEED